jgi:hypothetical protein
LEHDLRCPHCGHQVTDLLWFGWGYSDAQQPVRDNTYKIGDTIRWRSCADGTIPAWGSWPDMQNGLNIGDPTVLDLITLDTEEVGWGLTHCVKCREHLPGAAIEIRDGRIQRCWVFAPGEFDRDIEYNLIESDGVIRPMPDWSDNLGLNRLWHRVPGDC